VEELDDGDVENDGEYIFCHGMYSEDTEGEKWVQCTKCFKRGMKNVHVM
jgi:hypothetical protein